MAGLKAWEKDEIENELKFITKRNGKIYNGVERRKKKRLLNGFCCESRDPEAVRRGSERKE